MNEEATNLIGNIVKYLRQVNITQQQLQNFAQGIFGQDFDITESECGDDIECIIGYILKKISMMAIQQNIQDYCNVLEESDLEH